MKAHKCDRIGAVGLIVLLIAGFLLVSRTLADVVATDPGASPAEASATGEAAAGAPGRGGPGPATAVAAPADVAATVISDAAARSAAGVREAGGTLISGDRVEVWLPSRPEMRLRFRVDRNGDIVLRWQDRMNRIAAAGLKLAEVRARLLAALRTRGHFLDGPDVRVEILDYAPMEVIVQGEVVSPGRFPFVAGATLTVRMAIDEAGGVLDTANLQKVTVTHFLLNGQPEVQLLDLRRLSGDAAGSARDPDWELSPDDVVYVPMRLF